MVNDPIDAADVWAALLYEQTARPTLNQPARRAIGHGLKTLYSPVLTEAPTGRLSDLLKTLGKTAASEPTRDCPAQPVG